MDITKVKLVGSSVLYSDADSGFFLFIFLLFLHYVFALYSFSLSVDLILVFSKRSINFFSLLDL